MSEPLPLAYYGHPVLRQRAEPIEQISEEIRLFGDALIASMLHYDGVGLAAPQVHRPLRMFAMRAYLDETGEGRVFAEPELILNPVLFEPSDQIEVDEEGCLSIPGLRGWVPRPHAITLHAMDIQGQPIQRRLQGINARIVMHETDHLNGRFFHERMGKREREAFERRLRAKQHLFGKDPAQRSR